MENKKLMLEVEPAYVRDVLWSLEELTGCVKHLLECSDSNVETSDRTTDLEEFGAYPDTLTSDDERTLAEIVRDQMLEVYISGKLAQDALREFAACAEYLLGTLSDHENEIVNDERYEDVAVNVEPLFDLTDAAITQEIELRDYLAQLRTAIGIGAADGEEDEYWND